MHVIWNSIEMINETANLNINYIVTEIISDVIWKPTTSIRLLIFCLNELLNTELQLDQAPARHEVS